MKCYTCNRYYDKESFGVIEIGGGADAWMAFICRTRDKHVGSVKLLVCPNCGAIHCTMRNTISAADRKR